MDRRQEVEQELTGKLGIPLSNVDRFKAIETATPALGCSMSHLHLLERAYQEGWPYIMIVEDDIQFLQPETFLKQANMFFDFFKKKEGVLGSGSEPLWDVLLLAGNNVPPYIQNGNFSVRVSHCQTTTGYIVRGHYLPTLIENIKAGIHKLLMSPENHFHFAIDKYWLPLQKKDRWYLVTPLTVVQREGYSDIEGVQKNYSRLMLDLEKKAYFQNCVGHSESSEILMERRGSYSEPFDILNDKYSG
jgi:glycosyl transferase family 25